MRLAASQRRGFSKATEAPVNFSPTLITFPNGHAESRRRPASLSSLMSAFCVAALHPKHQSRSRLGSRSFPPSPLIQTSLWVADDTESGHVFSFVRSFLPSCRRIAYTQLTSSQPLSSPQPNPTRLVPRKRPRLNAETPQRR